MRTAEIDPGDWVYAGLPKDPHRSGLPQGSKSLLWQYTPAAHLAKDAAAPLPVRESGPIPAWTPALEPFPGEALWWDEARGCLYALSEAAPRGVRLECEVDAAREIGDLDPGAAGGGERSPVDRGERRDAAALVRQLAIGAVSRRCIVLPAPGTLRIEIDRMRADELKIAYGVAARAYRLSGDRVEPARGGSDGVLFAVDAVEGEQTQRLWSRLVAAGEVGRRFEEASVDLRRFRDRSVALRLVTEPGPSGERWFDYGAFADLRFAGSAGRPPERPHIVLIDMDTLRADRLGCYGHRRATTPRLDAWAASRALVFRDAISTSSWTLPATSSMVTGLAVHQHGAVRFPGAIPQEARTLAAYLREAGYGTQGFVEGAFLGPAFGFDRGFDLYDWSGPTKAPDWSGVPERVRTQGADRPLFLFLHTYLVHAPYPPEPGLADPENVGVAWLADRPVDYEGIIDPYNRGRLDLDLEQRKHISRRYDALVARADSLLGNLLEGLEEALAGRDFAVIVTADHGEELFEHERIGHGHSLYGELLRVPLIVRFPGRGGVRPTGIREEPVSLLDIVPTVLDLARAPIPAHLPGLSLGGSLPRRRVRVAEMDELAAIDGGGMKLLLGELKDARWSTAPVELYDLGADPGERRNLAADRREEVLALRKALEQYRSRNAPPSASPASPSELEAAELRRLRGMGYLGAPH
jgi:arylsulfatase A-like enzyme